MRAALLPVLLLLLPAAAVAQEGEDAPGKKRDLVGEVGVSLGVLLPSAEHELYDPVESVQKELSPAVELGVRGAILPIPYLGAEVEGNLAPASVDGGGTALLWSFRGHLLGQVPGVAGPVTPFALLGAGRWGVSSDVADLGSDSDGTLHYGLGAKLDLSHWLALRLDVRQTWADAVDPEGTDGSSTSHFEVLAGASWVLGRPAPPPPDTDGDGIVGEADRCPMVKGIGPDGCPDPDPDRDGFLGALDRCPEDPGIAPDGCPDPDPDKDGVLRDADKCPKEAGIPPDGCPDPDPDQDGVPRDADKCPDVKGAPPDGCDPDPDKDGLERDADKCPTEPETKNGWQDGDGCADQVPEALQKVEGLTIAFPAGQGKLPGGAAKALEPVAKALSEHAEARIEVAGHTDDKGDAEKNRKLSLDRAEAVKAFLVKKGVAADRIDTRGAGPAEPRGDNTKPEGRKQNNRAELKLVSK